MAVYEGLMGAVESKDIKEIEKRLINAKGLLNVNHICSNGTSLVCAAAKTGDLNILKMISNDQNSDLNDTNQNYYEPKLTNRKNIGYFVFSIDCDENEFGDGPTPEGMEDLQWDTEMENEFEDNQSSEECIYTWYAKILTNTPLYLESPEYNVARLDGAGMNVLHYAVNSCNCELVEYVLKKYEELDVNQCDVYLSTPLHMAVRNKDEEMVRLLLRCGAHVNIKNREEQTVVHIAAQNDASSIMNILIENKADIHALDHEGRNSLIFTVIHNSEASLRLLIEKGARINYEDDFGFTVLRRAVWMNNTNLTKILIENGARIFESHSLLHLAARNNNLAIIQILMKRGARCDVRDSEGNTPLMIACSRKNFEIAKYLLQNGATPNIINCINGMTALHVCVQDIRDPQAVTQFIDLLITFGANVNSYSHQCGSVLFYAIHLENNVGACELIRHGVNINFKDKRVYFDNLSLAKRHGNLALVKMVVYSGFKFSNTILEVNKREVLQDTVSEFLWECKTKPMNLRELCRICIRGCLGDKVVQKIYTLPLPKMMHKYLALEIL